MKILLFLVFLVVCIIIVLKLRNQSSETKSIITFISELVNKVKMKNLLVIAVLVICVIVLIQLCNQKPEKKLTNISVFEIKNEVKSVKELAVLKQPYKLLIKDNKENCLVGKHVCSSASFSVVCDYTMQIGFNLDKVQITTEDNGFTIIIRYPKAKVLSWGNHTNCKSYELKQGFWNQITNDELNKIKGSLEEKEQDNYWKEHGKEYNELAAAQLKKLIMKRLTLLAHGHNAELIEYPEKEYLWNKMVLDTEHTYAVIFEQIEEE